MPEPPDDYELTETDLDLVIEEATGTPVKPANLAAGIASMRQRITQLETEKSRLLGQLGAASSTSEDLTSIVAAINKDLAAARKRVVDYEAQLGGRN